MSDNEIPVVSSSREPLVYRYNTRIYFGITDNTAPPFNWKLYLNGQLYDNANNNGVFNAGVGYTFENLDENSFYSVKILATDSNGNESMPYEFSFTTTGDTFVGDLEFIEIPISEIEFFDYNQYVAVIGNIDIWNIGFNNGNSSSFFSDIQNVVGNITFDGIVATEPNINVFPDLIHLDGNLTLLNTDSTYFFDNLETISGELQMVQCAQNPENSNNPLFENLIAVGDILMYAGGVIHSVSFNSLTTINTTLLITSMGASFQNLNFLTNVTTIGSGAEISFNMSLTDFCGLQTVFNSNGLNGNFVTGENAYNPTIDDIQNGNCRQ